MIKRVLIFIFLIVAVANNIRLYAEEISWPFKLRYHSNPYKEEWGNLEKSGFYKTLIETCKEKERHYSDKGMYLTCLRNLTLDTCIKWVQQQFDEPNLICKITTDDSPKFRVIHMIDSSFPQLTPDTICRERKDSIERSVNMWSINSKEYTRFRAVRIMSTGFAYGFFYTELPEATEIEDLAIEMYFSVVIPDNISRLEDLGWDSTLKIVRFKIVYNLLKYFENKENVKDNPEYQIEYDCEALRLWDIGEVEIEGEEVKSVDFLKGESSLLMHSYGWL